MFQIGFNIFLYILIIALIFFTILFIVSKKINQKKLKNFASENLHKDIILNYSNIRKNLKFIFLMVGLGLLLFAASDPKIGSKLEKVKIKNAEIMVLIDVSNSMLAEDVYPNRLEAAKMAVSNLIDKLENFSIGLIVFAGEPYLQMPLTFDFISAKMFLQTINTNIVPVQGTNIGAAIEMALNSFNYTKHNSKKFIILITDGEDHENYAIEMAKEAQKKGVTILAVAIGKPEGAPIPITDKFGRKEYKTDKYGNIIITKANLSLLQQISSITNGISIQGLNFIDIANIIKDKIEKTTKTTQQAYVYTEFDHQYKYPLILSFLFLSLFLFFPEKKSKVPFKEFVSKFKLNKKAV